ncbi:hypothetical protein WJX74_007379 [Apatococcus lobatus]|uniref:BTB domain-containing protein n=2 Tax=Apatococcus TaxID=904362 RepID=A0AAW1T3B9_9CHLO
MSQVSSGRLIETLDRAVESSHPDMEYLELVLISRVATAGGRRQMADANVAVRHLAALPKWLAAESTDIVLAVGQTDFQVHGLLLSAQSEVLAQAIAYRARQSDTVPLPGDEVDMVAAALTYLYRRQTIILQRV